MRHYLITLTLLFINLLTCKAQKIMLSEETFESFIVKVNSLKVSALAADTETPNELDFTLKGYNIGLGIGANFALGQKLFEATISPLDQTLRFDETSKTNLTLTTLFMIPLRGYNYMVRRSKNHKKIQAKIYQISASPNPDSSNKTYAITYGPYLVANVNYADFTKAASVKPFNQTISGGIGFGWRFNDVAMLALTADAAYFKQPRGFLNEKVNSVLTDVDGKTITSLDSNNSSYFHDITSWSLSLKLVYILGQSSDN